MDGIILVDKIKDITSYDVIRRIKKHFHIDKVGHCGTLDPFATGLLIIGINQATKVMSFMQHDYKEYIAKVKLGSSTDSYDLTGKVISTSNINKFSKETLIEVLNSFVGKIKQTPPIYSAIQIDGKRLYDYARNNESVEIPEREVDIYKLELISFSDDEFEIYVKCSMGTYIRTLGVDIAKKLNNDGHLIELRRVSIGDVNVNKANSYQDLLDGNINVLDIRDFIDFKNITTTDVKILTRVYNGQTIILKKEVDDMLLIVDAEIDKVCAVYKKSETECFYNCYRGLYNEDIRFKRLEELKEK